jgi:hypothetical protein
MSFSVITAEVGDNKECGVGVIEWDKGYIRFNKHLFESSKYTTSDGQSYYSVKSDIPADEGDFNLDRKDDFVSRFGEPNRDDTILVGYIRRSNAGAHFKISINEESAQEIREIQSQKREEGRKGFEGGIMVGFRRSALVRVMKGERAVTTITSIDPIRTPHYVSINRKTIFDRKA